ncbi:MAG: ATP synthase F0 subunit B [Eubacterium sp.]|nr:ATP synthase F0 subunit B [Eubacterium sp.]
MPLNIDFQQILLHMFNLVLLFFGLYFILYKPVRDFMDKRMADYKKTKEDSVHDKEEAEAIKKEYEEKIAAAEDEISAMRKEADEKVSKENAARIKEAKQEAEEIIQRAKRTAQDERDRILENANAQIKNLAMDAASKLLMGEDVSDTYERFLDDAERSLDEQ